MPCLASSLPLHLQEDIVVSLRLRVIDPQLVSSNVSSQSAHTALQFKLASSAFKRPSGSICPVLHPAGGAVAAVKRSND